ncbi:MAG: flavoprotein [Planctomycetota bacterium]
MSESDSNPAGVAVIGAGGAGLLAGIAAAGAGARTLLYERMPKPAKKVAISGGGRCNFSNTLEPRAFVREFGDPHVKHLGHALKVFDNKALIELLKKYGVEGELERHYRLYTSSGRGQDVVDALVKEFLARGGELFTNAHVGQIEADPAGGFLLRGTFAQRDETRHARTVVVCTGGLSYPQTGSTGDGYQWARGTGHAVTPLRAALVGLRLEEEWPRKLSGTAWPDAACRLWRIEDLPARKPVATERKEMLFTHFGISGPAILDLSNAYVLAGLDRARLTIDFFPDRSREDLEREMLERLQSSAHRPPRLALLGMLPARLLDALEVQVCGTHAPPSQRVTREQRRALLDRFKQLELTVLGTRGMEWGEVTAGGLDWKDIDPRTMESKRVPGLYFAGEILDLAGRCGGFNLQAAFSTGYLAGQSAARTAAATS